MKKIFFKKTIVYFSFFTVFFAGFPIFVFASNSFFIDPSYDLYNRREIEVEHIMDDGVVRFFIDKEYYKIASEDEKNKIRNSLSSLGEEFNNKIYPRLTSFFGEEPSHPDGRVTVLFHQMSQGAGGYFNTGDQYSRYQYSRSNERNILYLNVFHINNPLLSPYLAHEFIHLITFNQKEKKNNVSEEVWLNELRAEYAITYLGYDNTYRGSNLENRVNLFLKDSNISLTEWSNRGGDYGAINLFAQYLVDHYGAEILAESLKSSRTGIESIDYALEKKGFEERFSDIFTDWTITLFVNDCSLGEKYCYKNPHLKNLRVVPQTTYIPFGGESKIIVSITTKEWAGNWQRIIGGEGNLVFNFEGEGSLNYKVPYILCNNGNDCSVLFLNLDNNQRGKITVKDFDGLSLTVIPSIQNKRKNFSSQERTHRFTFEVLTEKEKAKEDEEKISELLEKIELLKKEVERLKLRISGLSKEQGGSGSLPREEVRDCIFLNNLYFGIMSSNEVACLQEFLKNQGSDIYPEGIVTGNFLSLTRNAVIRFQEKYASEILTPLGLVNGTGFIGGLTRAKINRLL